MALQRAQYTGTQDIISGYDAVVDSIPGGCIYSVWVSSKDIAFQCIDNDQAKAKRLLEAWLESIEESGTDDIFYLKFHPIDKKGGFITKSSTVICMCPIRVNPIGEGKLIAGTESGRVHVGANDMNYKMYKFMEDMPTMLESKINAAVEAKMSAYEDIEPEPEIDPGEKIMGIINGIASNPQIMGIIGQVLNFLKPNIPAPRINGMNEQPKQDIAPGEAPGAETQIAINEDILNEALGRLNKVCRLDTDLLLLADMAEQKPALFNMLLAQLRS